MAQTLAALALSAADARPLLPARRESAAKPRLPSLASLPGSASPFLHHHPAGSPRMPLAPSPATPRTPVYLPPLTPGRRASMPNGLASNVPSPATSAHLSKSVIGHKRTHDKADLHTLADAAAQGDPRRHSLAVLPGSSARCARP